MSTMSEKYIRDMAIVFLDFTVLLSQFVIQLLKLYLLSHYLSIYVLKCTLMEQQKKTLRKNPTDSMSQIADLHLSSVNLSHFLHSV